MRLRGRVDANQPEIVAGLRKMGCGVLILSNLGNGAPDVLCSFRGGYYLFEIKDGSKPPSAKQLTPDEREWIEAWPGKVYVVESLSECVEAMLGVA